MTVKTFNIINGTMTLVVDDPNPPTTVLFTLADGLTTIARTVPDSTAGTEYTYTESVTDSEGIFSVVIDATLGTETTAVIGDITTGVSYLLYKTLRGEKAPMLHQKLYAVERYIIGNDPEKARALYGIILSEAASCGIGAYPETVNTTLFIVDGVIQYG